MYKVYFKRPFDFSLAIICLIILAPILVLLSLLILIFDGGPIIFVSFRTGRNESKFKLFKFRSMPVGTKLLASDDAKDIKIKPLGKFLRRFNFDELPQLWNILIGDMSFVGPRPPLPSQKELIKLRKEHGILNCRPGLTGLAQINGYDGMQIEDKAKQDFEYASKITFLLDIQIILKTFSYIAKPPPTY